MGHRDIAISPQGPIAFERHLYPRSEQRRDRDDREGAGTIPAKHSFTYYVYVPELRMVIAVPVFTRYPRFLFSDPFEKKETLA